MDVRKELQSLGIFQGEFANLVGVSRVTVGHWCRGVKPSKFAGAVAKNMLDILKRAQADGSLADIENCNTAAERREFLETLIKSHS